MHPEIEKLLIIQDLDREIQKLRLELARYPGFLSARLVEIERARKKVELARDEARDLEKRVRATDADVGELRETLRKLLAQQAAVRNQREYDSLTSEMGGIEGRIGEADEKGLEALSALEALQARLPGMEEKLQDEEREYEAEVLRLGAREKEKKEHLEACFARRTQAAGIVDAEILHRYERLVQLYPANAVVPVEEGICGGCNIKILSLRAQELTRPDIISKCDSCHRFMYLPVR